MATAEKSETVIKVVYEYKFEVLVLELGLSTYYQLTYVV